jgi:hypothetical protein
MACGLVVVVVVGTSLGCSSSAEQNQRNKNKSFACYPPPVNKQPVVAAVEKKKTLLLKPHTHPYLLLHLSNLVSSDIPTNSVVGFGVHKSCIALFSKV